MKKKLLLIFGIFLIILFVIYNVGLDIGTVHLGKQTDDIEINNQYDIKSSDFYTQFLDSDSLAVVNLWATWCKPCLEEMPGFLKLSKQFPQVKFATLSIDKNSEKLNEYLSNHKEMPDVTLENANYRKAIRNILEKRSEKSLIYTDIVPVTYFIKKGKIVKKVEGALEFQDFVTIINTLK